MVSAYTIDAANRVVSESDGPITYTYDSNASRLQKDTGFFQTNFTMEQFIRNVNAGLVLGDCDEGPVRSGTQSGVITQFHNGSNWTGGYADEYILIDLPNSLTTDGSGYTTGVRTTHSDGQVRSTDEDTAPVGDDLLATDPGDRRLDWGYVNQPNALINDPATDQPLNPDILFVPLRAAVTLEVHRGRVVRVRTDTHIPETSLPSDLRGGTLYDPGVPGVIAPSTTHYNNYGQEIPGDYGTIQPDTPPSPEVTEYRRRALEEHERRVRELRESGYFNRAF